MGAAGGAEVARVEAVTEVPPGQREDRWAAERNKATRITPRVESLRSSQPKPHPSSL